MSRQRPGTSATEAAHYLESAFATCVGFGLVVLTAAEADSLRALRERLVASGAQLSVAQPSAEAVFDAPRLASTDPGPPQLVRWIEGDDAASWRELASVLNRSRERLRSEHAYLWVLAGPLELRGLMTVHAQDIYSGAYKAPHVTAHAGAQISWLQLSDLKLGESPRELAAQRRFLADLKHQLESYGANPDLVLVSGDLGVRGHAQDYAQVDDFFDSLLAAIERRCGVTPILLAVPGDHDVSPHESPWQARDASLVEPSFTAYQSWAERRVLNALRVDELALAPGRCYLRSFARSHMPSDWSVVVEKDDLRLGIIGLDTASAAIGGPRSGQLSFEQFAAALGPRGLARLDEMQHCVLLTHHGPNALSAPSKQALIERIYGLDPLRAHAFSLAQDHGLAYEGAQGPTLLAGPPFGRAGTFAGDSRSGYAIVHLARDGRVEQRSLLGASRFTTGS